MHHLITILQGKEESVIHIDPNATELTFNPKYEVLFAPTLGPENPFKTQQQQAKRNMLSGYVEPAYISSFEFENQRRTFNSFGYALDPTVGEECSGKLVGAIEEASTSSVKTVFESTKLRPLDTRKRYGSINIQLS